MLLAFLFKIYCVNFCFINNRSGSMVQIKIGNNEKQADQNIEMTLKDGNLIEI